MMSATSRVIREHPFLKEMFADNYFPGDLVERGKKILLALCERIERETPANSAAVLALTHDATMRFNELAEEFEARGSEIETAARDVIGTEFEFILRTYGLDVDVEAAIRPRTW